MKDKLADLRSRIRDNFNKNRVSILVIFLIWAVAVTSTLIVRSNTLGKLSSGSEINDAVRELTKDLQIVQVVPVNDEADGVSIMLATYARKNKGKISIKIEGEDSHRVYADTSTNAAYIQDNAFISVPLNEKLDLKKDKRIIVTLGSDCAKGSAPGVYYSTVKAFENSSLKFNGILQEGDLTIRFLNDDPDLMFFYRMVIIWIISGLTFLLFLLLLVKPRYEVLFSAFAIVFGLTFLVIMTPMSPPDETVHYEFSLQVSNQMMQKENYTFVDEEYINYSSFAGHKNVSAAYQRLVKRFNRPLSLDNNEIELAIDIDWRYKAPFVPQAIGITIARLMNMNMLRTFYLGRLTNLLFYVCCVYIAIKRTPTHKVLLGTLATLPIYMQQAASFSYDSFVNGLSLVTISAFLNLYHKKEEITWRDILFVTIVSVLLSPAKAIYSFFFLLFWFIPTEKYGGTKKKLLYMLLICSPAIYQIADVFIPYIPRIYKNIVEALNTARNETGISLAGMSRPVLTMSGKDFGPFKEPGEDTFTIGELIRDPLQTFMLFYRTIRYGIKNWFYGAFGRSLSGETLILPTSLVHSLLVIVVFASLHEEKQYESLWIKVIFIGMCIVIGLSVMAGMLLSWTETDQEIVQDYGGMIIQGIQGRYFAPLLPFVFPVLNNKKFSIPERFDKYILSCYILIVFEVMVYVLSYTFVN